MNEHAHATQKAKDAARRHPGKVVFVTCVMDGYFDKEKWEYISWNNYDYTTEPAYYRENELLDGYCFDAETGELEYIP